MRNPCTSCSNFCDALTRNECQKYWDYQDNLFEHRKWVRGKQIKALGTIASCDVVWIRGRVENRGWFQNWTLREIESLIKAGLVYRCKPNPFYRDRRK